MFRRNCSVFHHFPEWSETKLEISQKLEFSIENLNFFYLLKSGINWFPVDIWLKVEKLSFDTGNDLRHTSFIEDL